LKVKVSVLFLELLSEVKTMFFLEGNIDYSEKETMNEPEPTFYCPHCGEVFREEDYDWDEMRVAHVQEEKAAGFLTCGNCHNRVHKEHLLTEEKNV
jgi:uncharacterized C2H2 Zn-finger protein